MSSLKEDITSAIDVMFKMRIVIKEQADRIAELEAALQKKGCARDQNTTQFCAEVVAMQKRVAELEGALRNARARYIELSDKDAAEAMAEIINEALGDVK